MLKLTKLLLVISWLLLIFLSSHIAFPPEDPNRIRLWYEYTYDKSMHLILYGVLAYLVTSFLVEYKKFKWSGIFWIMFLFCYFYGITDEYHQSFIPGRGVSYWDLTFNVFATIGGFLIYQVWHAKIKGRGLRAKDTHSRVIF